MITNPSQSDARRLVTIEDTNEPECDTCGHLCADHRMSGCHASVSCACTTPYRQINANHIERIVRREIAKELDRLVHLETIDMHANRYDGPEDVIQRAVLAEDITARAEEVRNG